MNVLKSASQNALPFGSPNSEHTAPLRSVKMLGYASHFACPQPLSEIPNPALRGEEKWMKE